MNILAKYLNWNVNTLHNRLYFVYKHNKKMTSSYNIREGKNVCYSVYTSEVLLYKFLGLQGKVFKTMHRMAKVIHCRLLFRTKYPKWNPNFTFTEPYRNAFELFLEISIDSINWIGFESNSFRRNWTTLWKRQNRRAHTSQYVSNYIMKKSKQSCTCCYQRLRPQWKRLKFELVASNNNKFWTNDKSILVNIMQTMQNSVFLL